MVPSAKTLVAIATYNEMENLPSLVEEIFRRAPGVDLLVIDDDSPDGTGRWCDQKAAEDQRVRCLHRPRKAGLGTATIAGLQYAVDRGYTYVVNMDADFSHHPRYLNALLAGMETGDRAVDVMIGSRYCPGGGVEGWPLRRRWTSRAVNLCARWLLGLEAADCSGAFRCYRVELLRRLDFDAIRSRGYSVFEELLWRLKRLDARMAETPIVFTDRQKGRSKINLRRAIAAVWIIFRLGVRNRLGV